MATNKEWFLMGESDHEISDQISQNASQHLGYQVTVVSIAFEAIQQVIKFTLDLVLSNIEVRV